MICIRRNHIVQCNRACT